MANTSSSLSTSSVIHLSRFLDTSKQGFLVSLEMTNSVWDCFAAESIFSTFAKLSVNSVEGLLAMTEGAHVPYWCPAACSRVSAMLKCHSERCPEQGLGAVRNLNTLLWSLLVLRSLLYPSWLSDRDNSILYLTHKWQVREVVFLT